MMTMVVELIRELRIGKTPNKKKKMHSTRNKQLSRARVPDHTKKRAKKNTNIATDTQAELLGSKNAAIKMDTETSDDDIELNSADDNLGSAASDTENDEESTDEEEDSDDEEDEDDNDSSDGSRSDSDTKDSSDESIVTPPARNNKHALKTTLDNPLKDKSKATIPEKEANDVQLQQRSEGTRGYQDVHQESYNYSSRKVSTKQRMSTAEARRHTKESIAARKKELSERAARKNALQASRLVQTPMIQSESSSPGPSTPQAKRERTRQRSPGGTPSDEVKMQRTSKAPEKPSTQDELARALDYSSFELDAPDTESLESGTASQPI
jgi:hypothetical protein